MRDRGAAIFIITGDLRIRDRGYVRRAWGEHNPHVERLRVFVALVLFRPVFVSPWFFFVPGRERNRTDKNKAKTTFTVGNVPVTWSSWPR